MHLQLKDIGMVLKHVFRYLQGSIVKGLFYSKESISQLTGYVDVGLKYIWHRSTTHHIEEMKMLLC